MKRLSGEIYIGVIILHIYRERGDHENRKQTTNFPYRRKISGSSCKLKLLVFPIYSIIAWN